MSLTQLDIRRTTDRRVAVLQGNSGFGLSWGGANALYFALKRLCKNAQEYDSTGENAYDSVERPGKGLAVRRVGLMIVWELEGRLWLETPWEVAVKIGKAIYGHAKQLEEDQKAEQVIRDSAILLGSGINIGLTLDPSKKAEIVRALGGIPSASVVGTPAVDNHNELMHEGHSHGRGSQQPVGR